ncbi:MBL fold metallo-hydrolase [Paenibacillus sp. 1001270B_150601_E10]|uniref:MBL fold metallo-hydrolase n=1 Tax=Paenibacillus sp. 1001270B_150601_E10 TaxID=2787079 RepID=UPI0018A04868|nr:MBL fold metallo-hydrolase [Paenibacillus sp. 1001270B_150601_E10]
MLRETFRNLDDVSTIKPWQQFRRWRKERHIRLKQKDYTFVVPRVEPDLERLSTNRTDTTYTWVGHSTFLLQMSGLNIVTDPVWATSMAMVKRLSDPGLAIKDVPTADLILISHSHYDHLHLKSLRMLYKSNTLLVVPTGLKNKMKRLGFKQTIEMKWWETKQIGDLYLTFVPAQHWTRRTLTDTNRSHWGGYVLENEKAYQARLERERQGESSKASGNALTVEKSAKPGLKVNIRSLADAVAQDKKGEAGGGAALKQHSARKPGAETLYFAGDSGYFRGFQLIGERFDIDIAFMPIGAYEPEWFMSAQHVNPEQALQAFIDCGARFMIPMHYGAFKLADDTPKEAMDRLIAEQQRREIPSERIRFVMLGETIDMASMPKVEI